MLRHSYQVAHFTIANDYQLIDFLEHRKHWWADTHQYRPGFQTMFVLSTKWVDESNRVYHVDVKAYRRNEVNPHVGKVA